MIVDNIMEAQVCYFQEIPPEKFIFIIRIQKKKNQYQSNQLVSAP